MLVTAPPAGPAVDGKFIRVDGRRFPLRGVTYGTLAATEQGLFGELEQVKRDFAAMAGAGINTVRTYTVPGPEILDLAEEYELKLLVGIWWHDPRYLRAPTAAAWTAMAQQTRTTVRKTAAACGGHPAVLGFLVGNEIPGPVVRWHGRRRVDRLLRSLYEAGKDAAPDALFGYANYPTTEYLDTGCFDFEASNVFLEDEPAWRRYLAQLQVHAGGRPLVLTELGLDSGVHGAYRQAEVLEWQLRAAMEYGVAGTCVFSWTDEWWVADQRVDGWRFGLTTAARDPKPALAVVGEHYRRGVLGCRASWPRVSVVVCAYEEEATIGQCLASLSALEYPDYEVVVVDDGSTDRTAAVASRYPVRLLSQGHGGLCVARNLGLQHASGEVVAYIDADAYADPDWLTYLVLGLDAPEVAGVGGPNPVPPQDPPVAQCVHQVPGGPVHVLLDNERAEHVPGCNMAFRRDRLLEIGGFDPIYHTAGDDVDVCWKLQDRGYDIRFHPAAVVWHHPRRRVGAFWRQQVGYGRAEALVARNHPDKFVSLGRARWRGVIYGPAPILPGRSFVYGGRFGEAPYQRLYHQPSAFGLVTALYVVAALAVLAVLDPRLAILPGAALLALLGWCLGRGVRLARRARLRPAWRMGGLIGLLHILQPLAREWGRQRAWRMSFPSMPELRRRFPPLRPAGPGLWAAEGVAVHDRCRFLEELRDRLRAQHVRATVAPPWGEDDLTCHSTLFWQGRLTACVQWDTLYLRDAYRMRRPRAGVVAALLLACVAAWSLALAIEAAVVLGLAVAAEGWWFRRRVRGALAAHPYRAAARAAA